MSSRSARFPCRQAHCSALLVKSGFCDKHKKTEHKKTEQKKALSDEDYKERNRFYQRKAWKDLRRQQLNDFPFCCECNRSGRLVAATVVDHAVPISAGGAPLDKDNLQSLCVTHHNAKTRAETNRRPGAG